MEPFVDGGFRIGEKGTLLVPINVQVHLGHVYASICVCYTSILLTVEGLGVSLK